MGKFSLVYILGLSLIVAYALWNINATGTYAMDSYTSYFGRTMAHNIALAGANVGTQLLLRNPGSVADLSNQPFADGEYDLHFYRAGDSAFVWTASRFNVTGEVISDTVIAQFKYTPFSKYGWFTETENNGYVGSPYYGANDWKITGDSVFGLAHTNNHFNLGGTPYFRDKVTATTAPSLMAVNGVTAPVFAAGYQWGITVGRPLANLTNLATIAASASTLIDLGQDVALEFFSDGNVNIRIPPVTGTTRNDTLLLTDLAPTGVLVVKDGDVRVKGTYKGQITIGALQGATTNKGNVWIDGNGILASDNPMTNPNSQDMMGIVAENYTYITRDDSRDLSSNVIIDAAVYCYNGELTAQDFWLLGLQGRVTLFGGVTQKTAGSLGVFSGGGLQHGMNYTIWHDPRFMFKAPPSYPISDKYELVSWWEN
jgi:hypothetical protein